jgi:hypothetical protein
MGAIERGGKLRVRAMTQPKANKKLTSEFVSGIVSGDAEFIFTDESVAYPDFTDWNTKHQRVTHSAYEWVNGNAHTNTVESAWSLFERAVMGSYHKLSVKHCRRTWTSSRSASTTARTRTCSATRS